MAIINMSSGSGFLDYRGYDGYDGYQGNQGYPQINLGELWGKLDIKTHYDIFYSRANGEITPMLIFYYTFPLILIYLIEFQNVTFRRLAKRCDLQPKGAPIASYIIALTLASAVFAGLGYLRVYLMKTFLVLYIMRSSTALLVIGIIMLIKNNGLRWKTKSIYEEHTEHLLAEGKADQTSSKEKSFSELLVSNWKVLIYEITQKCVLLIAITGEPISTFACAFLAYVFLAITAAVKGRSVAKQEVQTLIRIFAAITLFIWVQLPILIYAFTRSPNPYNY